MAKRSDMERKPRDWYPTPHKGAIPLIEYLKGKYDDVSLITFVEPFAGDGALTDHLTDAGLKCVYESDIEPQNSFRILRHGYNCAEYPDADYFISNPPWVNTKASGYQLFDIIKYLSSRKATWLLLDGGFAFNVGSAPYMEYCTDIVPVGRLKWIPDSKHTGTEDCAWFRFDMRKDNPNGGPIFHPRHKVKK